MKYTIKIKNTTGQIYTQEVKIRDLYVTEVRRTCKSTVFKPKKGKGSFVRNKKGNMEEY